MRTTTENIESRIAAFDGLRGLAILVVILSHGWTLWPTEGIAEVPIVAGIFNSGNTAVTVFFCIGAYLLTRAVLHGLDGVERLPWRTGGRRFIRLSAQVYPLLLALAIVSLADPTDRPTDETNRRSIGAAATYTWNWLLLNDAAGARPDMGHLWYVSVDLQVSLLLIVLVWLLRRRLIMLAGVLGVGLVLVMVWRAHVLDVEGWVSASLRTTTRCDPMLGGALIAVVTRFVTLRAAAARALATLGAAGLLVVVGTARPAGDLAYLGWAGVVGVLSTMALVAGVAAPEQPLSRPLSIAPLRRLGTLSLALYVWHYSVFWAVARHSGGWPWPGRTAVALGLTACIAWLTERFCERPTRDWLKPPSIPAVVTSSGATG